MALPKEMNTHAEFLALNFVDAHRQLKELGNDHVMGIVGKYAELCQPEKITILTGTTEDFDKVKQRALDNGEEKPLATPGHTYHFDGFENLRRDPKSTKVLIPKGEPLPPRVGDVDPSMDKEDGLAEMNTLLNGSMKGKEMIVAFYSLGPTDSDTATSKFAIPALQITDSYTAIHNANLLYRQGYEKFKKLGGDKSSFFHFVHSAGELANGVSKNTKQRRVYIDITEGRAFSVNTQYPGEALGLKKLALRLAIYKAVNEGWLAEHMFLSGIDAGDGQEPVVFAGAFPSSCGKTTTALQGQIICDDLAYMRNDSGQLRAAAVETGIFGILKGIDSDREKELWNILTNRGSEVIFSNNMIGIDHRAYWQDMNSNITLPESGQTPSGQWFRSHHPPLPVGDPNARFTIPITALGDKADLKSLDDPEGVKVSALLYGGRDRDTMPPVSQALDWVHGVFMGASLESETTSATTEKQKDRRHDPFANIDFMTIPLGDYITNHLQFGNSLSKKPDVFTVNYFLREGGQKDGKFLNDIKDKRVWLRWMAGRTKEKYQAVAAPIGYIPKYEDLRNLFKDLLNKDYSETEYETQFAIRVPNLLAKLDRVTNFLQAQENVPPEMFRQIEEQRERLEAAKERYGKDIISPFDLSKESPSN